ncbi:QueT transporter family protein [Aminomonas paucivorans]|uniref:QueT transporter family protein n=1 Tax=Aminomonas paucivorans TaxID=81412 RepID=UPI00332EDE52
MVLRIVRAGLVAALYVALVLAFAPLSFGAVQFRVAEVLTLLPFFWPEAVWGLGVGCVLSNLFGGFGLVDVLFGSLATLAAAWLSSRARTLVGAAIPPVVVNGLVVGGYLSWLTQTPWYLSIPYVALGEAGVCFALGIPLFRWLGRFEVFRKEGPKTS